MSQTSFQELIKGDKLVLVDFFAEWCGPCKMMKPELEKFKSSVGENVTVIKIDIDKNQKIAANYRIQSVPTLLMFKKGQIVWKQSGVVTSAQLQKVLTQIR